MQIVGVRVIVLHVMFAMQDQGALGVVRQGMRRT